MFPEDLELDEEYKKLLDKLTKEPEKNIIDKIQDLVECNDIYSPTINGYTKINLVTALEYIQSLISLVEFLHKKHNFSLSVNDRVVIQNALDFCFNIKLKNNYEEYQTKVKEQQNNLLKRNIRM